MAARARTKRILAPVDLSPASETVLATAVGLARQTGAALLVLHVIDSRSLQAVPPALDIAWDDAMKAVRVRIRARLEELVKKVDTLPRRVQIGIELEDGVPWHAIVERAESLGVDLIVMGTHGWRGLQRFVNGSTAERVVQKAPCSVLTLKPFARGSGTPAAGAAKRTRSTSAKKSVKERVS